jgi:hypothetical protein
VATATGVVVAVQMPADFGMANVATAPGTPD